MLIFYSILIVGHFVSDFLFQTDLIARKKKESIIWLILHCLIHPLVAIGLFLLFDYGLNVWILSAIFIQHFLIDALLITVKKRNASAYLVFIVDQMAHILVLFLIALLNQDSSYTHPLFLKILLVSTGFIGVTKFSGILMDKFTRQLTAKNQDLEKALENDLISGGKYIGVLERLIIYVLILVNQPLGVGFLLTIKSWLRLKSGSNIDKRIEYILIGTLFSFFLAVIFGIMVRMLLSQI
jgi:nitrate reductase NapE component